MQSSGRFARRKNSGCIPVPETAVRLVEKIGTADIKSWNGHSCNFDPAGKKPAGTFFQAQGRARGQAWRLITSATLLSVGFTIRISFRSRAYR